MIEQHTSSLPEDSDHYSMKWDGEWHITYEVFRDLGFAFAVVLVLIYALVVGWFVPVLHNAAGDHDRHPVFAGGYPAVHTGRRMRFSPRLL